MLFNLLIMKHKKIKGQDLVKIGFPEGKAIGMALKVIEQHLAGRPIHDVKAIMRKLLQYPESFLDDKIMAPIAQSLLDKSNSGDDAQIRLKETSDQYRI